MKLLIALCLLATALAGRPGDDTDEGTTNPCAAMSCPTGTRCEVVYGRGVCSPLCSYRNNEVWSACGGHCDTHCGDREPKICTLVCKSGCICRKGFARDSNKRCIPKDQCPMKCSVNMVLDDCVSPCQKKPTCELPNPPEPQCRAACRPMCVCKPGYVNNDEGVCILLSQCRPSCKTKKCKPGEYCQLMFPPCPQPPRPPPANYCPPIPVCRKCHVPECLKYVKCGYGVEKDSNGCYSRTCKCNPPPIPIEPCGLKCPPGYVCVNNGAREYCVPDCKPVLCELYCEHGWAQDERGCDKCACSPGPVTVPPPPTCADVDCPREQKCELQKVICVKAPCPYQPVCVPRCKAFEVYNTCASACNPEPTCAVLFPRSRICIALCVPRCECMEGFIRDENNRCISEDDCPSGYEPEEK